MIGLPLVLSLGMIGAWTAPYWGSTAPPEAVRRALESDGASGFWVYDRSGLLLRAIPEREENQAHQTGQEIQESRGRWIALGEMSPWVGEALVCLEDRGFWSHRGVPWRGVARAVWVNLRRGRLSVGGSGLTQQLVKLHHRRARGLLR